MKCPPATLDLELNLKNRQRAISKFMYGPPNPRLKAENEPYWRKLGSMWGVSASVAKTMRCGNCAAFGITKTEIRCIEKGLESEGIDAHDSVVAAELGYCRMLKFKCAASRTCSAWIVGGPIRGEK